MATGRPKRGRASPRWGWHSEWHDRSFAEAFTDDDIEHCLTLAKPKSSVAKSEFLQYLQAAFDWYWMEKDRSAPSNAEVRAAIQQIQQLLSPLRSKLRLLDDRSRMLLGNHFIQHLLENRDNYPKLTRIKEIDEKLRPSDAPFTSRYDVLDLSLEVADTLANAIERLEENLPAPKKGRPTNSPLYLFIGWMANAYEEGTGLTVEWKLTVDPATGAYWSPFLALLAYCLDHTDPDHGVSNAALGEAVRRWSGRT